MLPFVFVDERGLGPFHTFGICAALGFFAWDWAFMRLAVKRGIARDDARALTFWLLIGGTVFSVLVDTLFYEDHGVAHGVGAQGFSATGGFIGATVGAAFWKYLFVGKRDGKLTVARRAEPLAFLPMTEVVVATWPIAWAIGRLGCALIHDHPGRVVTKGTMASLFALGWPRGPEDGVDHVLGPIHVVLGGTDARFDLGLVECVIIAIMAIGFAATWHKNLKPGTYTIIATLVYGPARFLLDFLREGELRHGGLTFAQGWSVAIVALGLTLLGRRIFRRDARAPAPPASSVTSPP